MKRFQALFNDDPKLKAFPDFEPSYKEFYYVLVELDSNGSIIRIIAEDGGEPEDQSMGRDWYWVPKVLNEEYEKYQKEIKSLQEEIEELKLKVKNG